VLAGASSAGQADVETMRRDVATLRGTEERVPYASVQAGNDRILYGVAGGSGHQMVVVQLRRMLAQRPFASRDVTAVEQFIRQHEERIVAAAFNGDAHLAHRDGADEPIAFVVDGSGAVIGSPEEPADAAGSVRALFTVADGTPPLLAPVLTELLAAHRAGAPPADLIAVLPFALVRLMPLQRGDDRERYIVIVEWIRGRASFDVAALHYAISKRELQVLAAILRGDSVATIAASLAISESTVVFHVKRMEQKTETRNRSELAARMLGWEKSA